MSIHHIDMSEHVTITRGYDLSFGNYVQVYDKRYAKNPEDIKGEGCVLEWNDTLGFLSNLINASTVALNSDKRLLKLCNKLFKESDPT